MKLAVVVLVALAAVSVQSIASKRAITALFENAMARKIREMAAGDEQLENALNEMKKRYVEALDETLEENFSMVRRALNDRRRSAVSAEEIKRAFDTTQQRVHQKALRTLGEKRNIHEWWKGVENWFRVTFNDFGSWAQNFLGQLFKTVEPHVLELRDMALKLIRDGADELSRTAKEEAMTFFRRHSSALNENIKQGLKRVLGNQ